MCASGRRSLISTAACSAAVQQVRRAVVLHLAVRLRRVHALHLPRADAVDEADSRRLVAVQRELARRRPLGVEHPVQLLQRDDLREDAVAVLAEQRLVRVVPGGQHDDAGVQLNLARLSVEVDPLAADRRHALPALRAAAPVDRRHRRIAARVRHVDRLAAAEGEVELADRLLRAGGDRVAGVGQPLVHAARVDPDLRLEVADDALGVDDVRAGEDRDERVAAPRRGRVRTAAPRASSPVGKRFQSWAIRPPRNGRFSISVTLHAALGQVARRHQAGHAAADDERGRVDRDAALVERHEVAGAVDRRAHQADRLRRRRLAVLDDPRHVLADVDVLEEVLVEAGAFDRPPERDLVERR